MKAGIFGIAVAGMVCAATQCLACSQWNVSGPVTIEHASGLRVIGTFHQSGASLSGDARYYSRALEKGVDVPVDGTVVGAIRGDHVRFRIAWHADFTSSNGVLVSDLKSWDSTGAYEGTIASDGHIEGTNFDLKDSGNKGRWSLQEPAVCVDASPVPTIFDHPPVPTTASPAPAPFVTGPGHHLGKQTAPAPAPFVTGPGHHLGRQTSPNACMTGYFPRQAGPNDMVCVTSQSRDETADENAHAAERVDPNGAYGPNTCISGYVWREAFDGDAVCTTPERRTAVKAENSAAPGKTQ